MMKEIVAYHGPFLKIGENAWYKEFNGQKKDLIKQGIKTDLGQILLTGRDTDILLIAYNEASKPIGMAWGRLIKTFTHIDRAFVFPALRGQKIAETLVAYMLKTRKNLVWNAVHEAMDRIAKKFGGIQDMVEGYRGWVLTLDKYPGNIDSLLNNVSIFQYCKECKQKVPTGDICGKCGKKIETKVPNKGWST